MNESRKLIESMLDECKREKIMVDLYVLNGVRVPGCVMDFDDDVVIIFSEGRQRVVFKHAISTIVPEIPLKAIKR